MKSPALITGTFPLHQWPELSGTEIHRRGRVIKNFSRRTAYPGNASTDRILRAEDSTTKPYKENSRE